MANEEHLAILRQGVTAWNVWRETNGVVKPDLSRSSLKGASLKGCDFKGASLIAANLDGADLRWASLIAANLDEASLQVTSLQGTILSRASLHRVNLQAGNLDGAKLDGANLDHALVGMTIFANIDLRNVLGLDTVHHRTPSTIGIDTLYRSNGDIPESFLRGCGVPDSMIEYARALVAAERPIDYYSCFISHSSHDTALAERLYADLQAKGVRCWYAPHDMQIGEPILDGIDRGIRLHDKLLLILSEASVESGWVEQEVHMALAREKTEHRRVLFPIWLDDAVIESRRGWPAILRETIHIGDFRQWKDHDMYQSAFARLLRDLKAEKAG